MYGETLHRDADKAAQVEAWDSDPLLGPLMRQEVRADAQAFVHFYGAFAGYVARWLEVADAQVADEGRQPTPTGSVALRLVKRLRRVRPLRLRAGVADARFRLTALASRRLPVPDARIIPPGVIAFIVAVLDTSRVPWRRCSAPTVAAPAAHCHSLADS